MAATPQQRILTPSNERWLSQFSPMRVSLVIARQLADSSVIPSTRTNAFLGIIQPQRLLPSLGEDQSGGSSGARVARGSGDRGRASPIVAAVIMGGQNPRKVELGSRRVNIAANRELTRPISSFAYNTRIAKRNLGRLQKRAPMQAHNWYA